MSSATGEDDEDTEAVVRRCAAILTGGGHTAAWAREHAEGEPFYLRVADELAALEAAAVARSRFRIVLSQISGPSRPLRWWSFPQDSSAPIADNASLCAVNWFRS